jgi:hypothetical protein
MMQRAMDGRREEKRRECMMLVQLKSELNNAQNEASLFVLFPFFFLFPFPFLIFKKEIWSVLPFDSEAEKISLNCQERTNEKQPGEHPQMPPPWVLHMCI